MPSPGLSPYVQQAQQGAARTPYGMGGGYGASRYRPNLSGAVTGPTGSGGTGGGDINEIRNQEREEQQQQAQIGSAYAQNANEQANMGASDRAQDIANYRATNPDVTAASQQTSTATKLGIDPSASPADQAAAAAGPVGFDAQGLATGGSATPMTPTQVTTAAAGVQAQKDGALQSSVTDAMKTPFAQKPPMGPPSPFLNRPPGMPAAMPPTPPAGASAAGATPAPIAPQSTTSTNAPANAAASPANGAPAQPAKTVPMPKIVTPPKPPKSSTMATTMPTASPPKPKKARGK